MKKLVVYYSRTGKTKFVAGEIAKKLKADAEEIIDSKNRHGILGYIIAGYDAFKGKSTEINESRHNISKYGLVFIGFPVWGGKVIPAIRTYLLKNKPKKCVLFCTYNGANDVKALNNTSSLVKEVISKRSFKKPLNDKERTINEIKRWMEEINVLLS